METLMFCLPAFVKMIFPTITQPVQNVASVKRQNQIAVCESISVELLKVTFESGAVHVYSKDSNLEDILLNENDQVVRVESVLGENESEVIFDKPQNIGLSNKRRSQKKPIGNTGSYIKRFWRGHQIYVDEIMMMQISNYMDISHDAPDFIGQLSEAIKSVPGMAALSVALGEIGLGLTAVGLFIYVNWTVMKAFDKGQGVTYTKEMWGPGLYWFNSGDCVR